MLNGLRILKIVLCFISLFFAAACLKPQITQRDLNRQLALARAESEREINLLKAEIENLRKLNSQNAAAKEEVVRLQNELDRIRNAYSEIEKEKNSLETAVSKLQALSEETERLKAEASESKAKAEALEQERNEIQNELRKFIDVGGLGVEITPDGIMITMRENILFDSGKSDLKDETVELIAKVAEVLKKTDAKEIRIVGHTDNKPIRTSQFPSNWELSAARALSVLHILSDKHNVPVSKLSAVGAGEFRPIADNSTNEGRERNRRVEIYLIPEK